MLEFQLHRFLELQLPTFPRHVLESVNKRKDTSNVKVSSAMACHGFKCFRKLQISDSWNQGETLPDSAGQNPGTLNQPNALLSSLHSPFPYGSGTATLASRISSQKSHREWKAEESVQSWKVQILQRYLLLYMGCSVAVVPQKSRSLNLLSGSSSNIAFWDIRPFRSFLKALWSPCGPHEPTKTRRISCPNILPS